MGKFVTMFKNFSRWSVVITLGFSLASSVSTFARSTRLVASKSATSLSVSEASINSHANPRTRIPANNCRHLCLLSAISFQSQIISPRTPTNTPTSPGCLTMIGEPNQQRNESSNIEDKIRADRLVKRIILAALFALVLSRLLLLFKKDAPKKPENKQKIGIDKPLR